jgi:inosine-uridine nucleoside N-ribohydrolase
MGADSPLHPHPHRGTELPTFFGDNGFNNITFEPNDRIIGQNASEDLRAALAPGEIHYCLTGPCTNLASLIIEDPDYVKVKIERLDVMGGVLRGTGNEGPDGDKYAEFNFYLDAKAASIILGSGIPISLVTWDAAQFFQLSRSSIDQLRPKSSAAEHLVEAMQNFFALYRNDNHQNVNSEPALILSDAIVGFDLMGGDFTSREDIYVNLVTEDARYGELVETQPGTGHRVTYVKLKEPEKAISFLTQLLNSSR